MSGNATYQELHSDSLCSVLSRESLQSLCERVVAADGREGGRNAFYDRAIQTTLMGTFQKERFVTHYDSLTFSDHVVNFY
jgi:hypothetical protein